MHGPPILTVALAISVFQKTPVTGEYHCPGLCHEHTSHSQKKDSLIKEDNKLVVFISQHLYFVSK